MHQQEKSASDGAPALALKPMGRAIQTSKGRSPMAPQNGDFTTKKVYGLLMNVEDDSISARSVGPLNL